MTATILVVDDDDDVRALIALMLQDAGHRVIATGDPTQAVGLARSSEPDLVICDIAMPVMDGYDVVRALQADPVTAACPIAFLTARHQFSERVKAFRFGIVDYIAKPFTRELLTRKVERILRGLQKRPGAATGASSAALLEQAQFEGRSGVLSLDDGQGRLLLAAGRVVDTTSATPAVGAQAGAFRELDPALDHVACPEPEASGDDSLPDLSGLPAALRTALVVDDDVSFRLVLRRMLETLGFTVHEAGDGATGLQLALEQLPWLILTDVRMPAMDGLELCRRVREHSLLSHTPVVFLSGWDDYKDRYRSFEAGGDDFLSKRTPAREILIRIRLILGRYARLGGAMREAGAELSGELGLIGSPGLLQMCNAGRLTGTLTTRSGKLAIAVRFRDGEIVGSQSARHRDAEAVHEMLGWTRGHFQFQPGDPGPGQPIGTTFMQLLLDGCRLLDEQHRA
jgi:DNA-binding response OmpR family regulator